MQHSSAVRSTPDAFGDVEMLGFVAVATAGLVQEIDLAGEIVREMMNEAERLAARVG